MPRNPYEMTVEELIAHTERIKTQADQFPNNGQLQAELTMCILLLRACAPQEMLIVIEVNNVKQKPDPRRN